MSFVLKPFKTAQEGAVPAKSFYGAVDPSLPLKVLKGDPPLKAAFTAGMKDAKAPWSQKQLKGKKLEELTLALAAQMLQFLRMRLVSCFAENINQNRSKLHPFRVTNQLQRRC